MWLVKVTMDDFTKSSMEVKLNKKCLLLVFKENGFSTIRLKAEGSPHPGRVFCFSTGRGGWLTRYTPGSHGWLARSDLVAIAGLTGLHQVAMEGWPGLHLVIVVVSWSCGEAAAVVEGNVLRLMKLLSVLFLLTLF